MQPRPWKTLARRFRPHSFWFVVGLFLALLQSALAVPVAWLLRWSFDEAIPHQHTRDLIGVGLALFALRALSALAAYLSQRVNLNITRQFSASLRRELLEKVFSLPRQYYQGAEPGAVQDVLVNETERVDFMVRALLGQVFPSGILSLALGVVLIFLELRLFLVMLVVWPITWLLNEYFRRRALASAKVYNGVFRRYGVGFRWIIDCLDFVRVHHAESLETRRGQELIEELRQASTPVALLNVAYVQIQTVLLTCVSLVILLVGGSQVAQGHLSIGDLVSFFVVVNLLNNALREVAAGLYHVVIGSESMAGIIELLAQPQQLPYHGTERLDLRHSLELLDVSFSYRENQPLLSHLTLRLESHQWLALVGPNGSGKSTLLSLMLGFARPDQGEVRADGVDYAQIHIGHLRAQIGVVSQDPLMFTGSLLENVRYGFPEASLEQVEEALRLAAADLWVAGLPQGIDTLIGESGQPISGGQRQRLAIARAVLRSPRFLILDEPTNHLDVQAVGQIMQNLSGLSYRPAVLMVTHDEGIAQLAHQVYRLA